jgi:hypothetical protein
MTETLRDGRFVVVGRLGRGSQGETLGAVDKREGRAVAIKRFDVSGAQSWKDVELAEREARVLRSLAHPKLPGYIDHFESECESEDLPHRGLAVDVRSALPGLAKPPLIDVLERMLAPDPEDRADRIAPLLSQLTHGRARSRSETARRGGDAWDLMDHRHWERVVRDEERRAELRARRHAQRHLQRAMRAQWRGGAHPIPRPVGLVLATSFAVAMLAVTLATQVVVPLVLRILGLFFGPRALGNAAASVRSAGTAALASMPAGESTEEALESRSAATRH